MGADFIDLVNNHSHQDVFLVAVSGGPDSMALMHMLKDLNLTFVVCNVNYQTRKESDYEEEMVKNVASSYGMYFESCIASSNDIVNFQDSARVFRYTFFKEIYQKYNAKGLLVAHHLDDSLETYLLQKRRKSIVRHYGIAFHSEVMQMNVYRPLLNYRKKELLAYCQNNNVPYSLDYTNDLPKYQRNQIRLDIINKLNDEELNDLVCKMNAEEKENNELFSVVEQNLTICLVDDSLNVNLFKKIENRYKAYVLYCYLQPRINRSSKILSQKYLLDLINQIEANVGNKRYLLGKKYFLFQEYDLLTIKEDKDEDYCFYLNKDEEISTPYFTISKVGDTKNGIYVNDDEYPIMIRNFRNDDKISLPNGHKKLRRWFIDKKIPLSRRKKIPLLFTRQGKLIYIPCIYKDFERKNLKSSIFMVE